MKKRLLLISNSTSYGQRYLDHCADEIIDFLKEKKSVLFLPYALYDRDKYTKVAKQRFEKMGIKLYSLHQKRNHSQAIQEASALFVGGGNTFRLLNELYKLDVLKIIRERIEEGVPYIGVSAGVNIVCPTIRTTNDMPIIDPPSFVGLNVIPFQINPHYIDSDPHSQYQGETREQRIKEFHEENDTTVIGLREGAWLRIGAHTITLKGKNGAKLFQKDRLPTEYDSGAHLNFLI